MPEAEFEQLLRSINQQSDSKEKSRMEAIGKALCRGIASLFENPLLAEGPPALK